MSDVINDILAGGAFTRQQADALRKLLDTVAGGGGGGGATDHGVLTGLGDDDHVQYHNNARGDARYSQLAHNHAGVYDPAGTAASAVSAHAGAADPHPVYLTQTEADALYAAIGSGGADPWTYVKLGSGFSNATTTPTNVTGMYFTPAASKTYLFEFRLILYSSLAAAGVRPSMTWATDVNQIGAARLTTPTTATAQVLAYAQAGSTLSGTATAGINGNAYAEISGLVTMHTSPSGNIQLRLASETTDNVAIQAGSFLRWREVA